MLYLKALNKEDAEKEWAFITLLPEDENGFQNKCYGITLYEFRNFYIPNHIAFSKGCNIPEGHVPNTDYFLWDDDKIVGLFRLRHYLNNILRHSSGHIGYCIKKEYRGKGYATKGLSLLIEIAKKIIREDEIYFSVQKQNLASLYVQLRNGAYIHHEDEKEYYTRIKIR